jgi:thioredoxin 1
MNYFLNSRLYRSFAQILFIAGIAFFLADSKVYTPPVITKAPASAGIVFIEDSWTEALKQAAAKKKYIFVDAYATWCGPCKMLKATTFKDEQAAAFFNANFVNVAIDMEKGQGPQLARQWQLQAYPTLIIFDAQGKPVLGSVGYIKANDLLRFGKQALLKKAQ